LTQAKKVVVFLFGRLKTVTAELSYGADPLKLGACRKILYAVYFQDVSETTGLFVRVHAIAASVVPLSFELEMPMRCLAIEYQYAQLGSTSGMFWLLKRIM
jgi:hypothetical protein